MELARSQIPPSRRSHTRLEQRQLRPAAHGVSLSQPLPTTMIRHTLVIFFIAAMCTFGAHAENAPAAARANALADIVKLLRFVEQPAAASIASLSRQLGFDYTVRECRKVNSADDWCEYAVSYSRAPAAGIDSAAFGRDRITGLPTASLSWGVRDARLCLRRVEIEKIFGPGRSEPAPMPFLIPGEKVPPPMTLFSHPIGSGADGPSASALYSGQCLADLMITF